MKKLVILLATVILTATVTAQTDVASVKRDEGDLKKEEYVIKKEKKETRKELRKLKGKEVSSLSKQAFYGDFGNIPVSQWERTPNYDKATFTKDGEIMTAYYDFYSRLVGTTSYRAFEDLPASAQRKIDAKYPSYTKGDVVFFDDNELNETDMIMYGIQFNDADNYFVDLTKNGKEIILQADMRGNVSFFKQVK